MGDRISMYSPFSGNVSGSLFWRQNSVIMQSFIVEAIQWTRSGDALVVAGSEVVSWLRKNNSWQMLWKSRTEVPQTLISATWFADGPTASAAYFSSEPICKNKYEISPLFREACKNVSVYHNAGKSEITKVQLCHPQPVLMIQWRPSTPSHFKRETLRSRRDVLLTCCSDGSVRLWSEIDNGRARKMNEARRTFHVIVVLEVNQCLKGTLGEDVFIEWATEFGRVVSKSEGENYDLSTGGFEHDQIGSCEWLVSVGPRSCVSFWAVHCLDDLSPLRFPQVTLWKKQDLIVKSDLIESEHRNILVKVATLRSHPFGPPEVCSLLQLLPDDTINWLQIYSPTSTDTSERSLRQINKKEILSCFAGVDLNGGHRGKIIQLAVHPYCCDVELAVSLDDNGLLLFWSIPTVSFGTQREHMLVQPTWDYLGKISLQALYNDIEYSSLSWAPSILENKRFLLLSHVDGIDCFLVKIPKEEEEILCHKLFTIPFAGRGKPEHLFATPLASTFGQSFASNSFSVLAIWTAKFQALSWKVVLHHEDPSGTDIDASSGRRRYVSTYAGRMYYAIVEPGSSDFPDAQNPDQVTSFAVVPSSQQFTVSYNDNPYRFDMATGNSDGTLNLWKISDRESESRQEFLPWDLMGTFTAHHGPVTAISLSCCGCKIATVSMNSGSNTASLHIWEPIFLIGMGSFLLEDVICLNSPVVALNWLSIGNGQLFLGVCMPNELRIYLESRSDRNLEKSENSKEKHIWNCITLFHTYPASRDFLWGPRITPILVHEKHFSIFSQWLFKVEDEHVKDHSAIEVGKIDKSLQCAVFIEKDVSNNKKSSKCEPNKENGCDFCLRVSRTQFNLERRSRFLNVLDVAEMYGSLAVYHPKALMQYLYSGNWKRAFVVLKHFVGYMKHSESSGTVGKSWHSNPQINLSRYFEDTISRSIHNNGLQWGQDISMAASRRSEIVGFIDTIEKSCDISCITDIERTQILAIADLLCEITDSSSASPYEGLDGPGRRFWVSVRFQRLLFLRKAGRQAAAEDLVIGSDLVAWALQSGCQDNLLSSIVSEESSWLEIRNLGMGYWFTSASQLRTRMEKLARLQYLKNKDPKDCALLYLALNRRQVLTGLFKISKSEKDKLLVGFLSRNFQEDKNKAAALKNAYVLMGRHQLELAISFFLLGDDFSSAVSVCAKNLGDGQLALVICRLIEGYGGPLERHLISNVLLPDAYEKGDYWLSSLLEWTLGNYSLAFKCLYDFHVNPAIKKSSILCNHDAYSNPDIGEYCIVLAAKNSLKNAIGEYRAAALSKLSMVVAARALNKCGLPLEALECLSSSPSIEDKDQRNFFDIANHEVFNGILNPLRNHSCNWLLGSVACHLESNAKLYMAMHYISKLLKDHPSWPHASLSSSLGGFMILKDDSYQDECVEECIQNLNVVMSTFEQKYYVRMLDIANMILVFSCNNGLLFHGHRLLHSSTPNQQDNGHDNNGHSIVSSYLPNFLLKASKEILYSFARYIVLCSFTDSVETPAHGKNLTFDNGGQLYSRDLYLRMLTYLLRILRPLLKPCNIDISTEIPNLKTSSIFDLLEYCIYFASIWFRGDTKGLITLIRPILTASVNDESDFEAIVAELKKLVDECEISWNVADDNSNQNQAKQVEPLVLPIPEDEMWQLLSSCLWMHISGFGRHQLSKFLLPNIFHDESSTMDVINRFPFLLADSLITSLEYVSSLLIKHLATFLRQKALKDMHVATLFWLDEFSQSQSKSLHNSINQGNEKREPLLKTLWEISASPKDICECFVNENVLGFPYNCPKLSFTWETMQKSISAAYENDASLKNNTEVSSGTSESNGFLETRKASSLTGDVTFFHNQCEILKRSGELLETLCFNSINEQQGAVASNRKGLIFFNWKTKSPFREQAEYIWSDCDWPNDGWLGFKPTESKGRQHFGSDGAKSLARPGKDLTGGGAFGIPGYAGIGASGLGWGPQENFEGLVNLPTTTESVRSQALSSHPSRPFFLVGSSSAHIYLWEFGKDRASTTYVAHPPNVPPSYTLASISALQFDHYGHRFATASLDGTVSTWQLGVGERSNIHPTESSLCFNNHASAVAYVSASGSIVAAAGCSSNGVSVVVWDTLAPPITSQASLVCHEGGARSVSVFGNDIGNGSISPLIVTGGKSGDVGLHDFRYIATGRTKRNKLYSEQDLQSMPSENVNGMIWYIPKAHLGSVTKVATIPNTSLFLTGGKDGDVKLWDAKRSRLVFHWPKMHDRHTFLQPASTGFGGVVRAAITDIKVLSDGFLTCGGDGSVKLVLLR